MRFSKMQGTGNDFIIINNMEEKILPERFGKLAKTLCKRRFSLGADGVMFVEKPQAGGDFRMIFYNTDGSMGEMCGNGARCIARYGYEKGLSGEVQNIETTAGTVRGYREGERLYRIELNEVTTMRLGMELELWDGICECSYIELGEPGIPHIVVRIEGLAEREPETLRLLGKVLRYHKAFPKGVNVNFYDAKEEGEIVVLTYERGVEDFTLACGTGTASVVAVLTELGIVKGQDVKVKVPGGELTVTVKKEGGCVKQLYLTGLADMVAEGEIAYEDL